MIEALGWTATALFCGSYLVPPRALLAVQIGGALLWVAYGALTRSGPVVASNVIVVAAAGFSLWRQRKRAPTAR
jgi:hypothetical protein